MCSSDLPNLARLELASYSHFGSVVGIDLRQHIRFTQLAIGAALAAIKQSGLDIGEEDAGRCGVAVSSGIGGLDVIEEEHYRGIKRGFDRVSPLFVPMSITNMAAGLVAIRLGFMGSCTATVTACASSTNSIGEAFRSIRDGYAEVMAAGGSESCITEFGIGGFTAMRALSEARLTPRPGRRLEVLGRSTSARSLRIASMVRTMRFLHFVFKSSLAIE